jgi:hypothetical protein
MSATDITGAVTMMFVFKDVTPYNLVKFAKISCEYAGYLNVQHS